MNTIRSLTAGGAFAVALLGFWAMSDVGRAGDAVSGNAGDWSARFAQFAPPARPPGNVPSQPDFPQWTPGGAPKARAPAQDEAQVQMSKRLRALIEEGVAPTDRGCLPWQKIPDHDADFRRVSKVADLTSPNLCFTYDAFEEGGFPWILQIIQNTAKRKGPLWAVPHDDENAAFISAVQSVINHGGTVVAVETGGYRNLLGTKQSQDPNRNFDVGEANFRCRNQIAPSPEYTKRFLRWRDSSQPIIALHTNRPGGDISIKRPSVPGRHFPAPRPIGGRNPDHTLIFVSSVAETARDPNLVSFVRKLNERGINVIYELVSMARNDCSMSNYAALQGLRNYLNIEVVHDDTETQLKIVDIVMQLLKEGPIGELALPKPPAAGDKTNGGGDQGQVHWPGDEGRPRVPSQPQQRGQGQPPL
jgi:hypothetical protein